MLRILSLGAGVQSSALALMASRGMFPDLPEAAVFADTQSEPSEVYRWLDWLTGQLAFPVIRVTKGNLGKDACRVRTSAKGNRYTQHAVPAFIKSKSGDVGIMMRQCTRDHKIEVLQREYRRLRNGRHVEQWLGISLDEATRMKPSRVPWMTNRWPLIELKMRRGDCLRWMQENGFPTPPRSACIFCPYHTDATWKSLKDSDPDGFAAAVEFEKSYQAAIEQRSGYLPGSRVYLHKSCVPLDQVDLSETGQGNLFQNECEGVCGL